MWHCKSGFHCVSLVQSLLKGNNVIGNNQISSFELSRDPWPEVLYQKSIWNDRRSEREPIDKDHPSYSERDRQLAISFTAVYSVAISADMLFCPTLSLTYHFVLRSRRSSRVL